MSRAPANREPLSTAFDERARTALTVLASRRRVSRSRLMRALLVEEFARVFGSPPPGAPDVPQPWTAAMRAAYSAAYSSAHRAARHAGESLKEARRHGREAGLWAAARTRAEDR